MRDILLDRRKDSPGCSADILFLFHSYCNKIDCNRIQEFVFKLKL